VQHLLFLSDFNETRIFSKDFLKMLMSNVMKIRPVGAELLHADRQTNLKLIVAFRNFWERTKKYINIKTHFILATIKTRWIMQFPVVYVPDMNTSLSLLSQFDQTTCWMVHPVDSVTSHKCTVRYVFYYHTVWYCDSVTWSPGLVWSRKGHVTQSVLS